jgi:peptide/nickel transport system substrate-binding protein
LDGATLIDTHAINVSYQVRNTLTEIKADGDIAGELAESWNADPGAKRWSFKLRRGVEFHNGKSLDADDVIYSLNHHRGAGSKSGGAAAVAIIDDIKADGKDSVVFSLKQGNVDFPYLMADYHLMIVPAQTQGTDWRKGVGTGPFVLKHFDPGVRAETVRNPNYFKEGLPYFDAEHTLNVTDPTARVSALRSGQADLIEDPGLKTLELLRKVAGVRIIEAEGGTHFSLPMRCDMSPFDANNLRLAMKYAIDREMLLKNILQGHGYLGNDQPIGRNQRYFAADLPQRGYDPEKAKFYLKKAGVSSFKVALPAAEIYTGAVDLATIYQQTAKAAGISIDVQRYPLDGYWNDIWMKRPLSMVYWYGRATADWMFTTVYAGGASWNDTFWKNGRFDQLLQEARVEFDDAKRRQMYFEMQQIVSDDGGAIIPLFANLVSASTDKVATPPKIAGDAPLDGQRNAERWFFT